jgi:acyl-coenzyme A thioesterase PaaI-like protein
MEQAMKCSSTRLLAVIENRFPRIAPFAKKLFIEQFVSSNRSMGICVLKAASDSRELELSLRNHSHNKNFVGSVNGGVLLAFAECIHGIAVLWEFSPANQRMVTKRAHMEYLAPGFGDLYTGFKLSASTCSYLAKELADSGVCEVELSSTVTDKEGTEIAKLRSTYQIRRGRSESAGGGR